MFNIKKDFLEIKGLFKKINKKEFQGNTGVALKNSSYQFLINLSMKIGSLIFTILMARILLPEKMGLYSLALSTIVFFSAFSDLGINNALITYIPKKLAEKKESQAKGYFNLFLKWKIILSLIVSLILFLLSHFIANSYYNQPIFYSLLTGGVYILCTSFLGFYEQLFKAINQFKIPLTKEILFQGLRLFLLPLLLILSLNKNENIEFLMFFIISFLTLAYLISLFYLVKKSKKQVSFLKLKEEPISDQEKKNILTFLFPLTLTAFSGIFFGYIDIIMLGRYVQSQFISYYTTAFSLISSLGVIISFISMGIFPLLSSINSSELENIFKKAKKYSLTFSLLSMVFVLIFSKLIIQILYGQAYLPSSIILSFYSVLILVSPLITLYETYFISQKRTTILAKTLILTTLLNIFGNFFFINHGVSHYGGLGGILGACFATILSRVVYLGILWIKKKN